MHFDDVFGVIGPLGAAQIFTFVLVSMTSFWSYHGVAAPYVVMQVDHWCHIPGISNLTFEKQKAIAIPKDDNGEYSQCER